MYAQSVIDANLNLIQPTLPFSLERYPTSYRHTCIASLSDLINRDRWEARREIEFLPSRPNGLLEDEKQFVKNEQILCAYDYLYFARICKILHWDEKGLDYYVPNRAQLALNDVCAEMEAKWVAIFILQLKGRQIGMSSDNQLRELQRILFHHDTRGLTASSKEDKTRALADKFVLTFNNLSWYLLPLITTNHPDKGLITKAGWELRDSGEFLYNCDSMNCNVRLQYGNQEGGVGRGETPTFAHITEVPDWRNPKLDINSSLLKAMHPHPRTFFVAESTSKYEEDDWHAMWKEATTYYHLGKSKLYPVHFPWYIADNIYPTRAEVRAFMPSDYIPSDDAIHQAKKAKEYVRMVPLLRKCLGESWEMTKEQIWFWDFDRDQAKREKRYSEWLSEMAPTPEESFRLRGHGLFDAEFIAERRERSDIPLCVFGLTEKNDAIPFRHLFFSTSQIDREMPSIPVSWRHETYNYEFTLHPLVLGDLDYNTLAGKLVVWEMPDEDEEYGIGIDCGRGWEQDYSCLYVLKKGDYIANSRPKVVAAFYSNQISAAEFFPFALAIGRFYHYLRDNSFRQPQFAIERPSGGVELINNLIKAGWRNFYVDRELASKKRDPKDRIGIEVTQVVRDGMLSDFLKIIKDDEIEIHCQKFWKDLSSLGWNPTRRRMESLAGQHDDCVFALGWIYFSMYAFSLAGKGTTAEMQRRSRQQSEEEQQKRSEYDLGEMCRPVAAKHRNYSYWDNPDGY